jgi:hypothetical protein
MVLSAQMPAAAATEVTIGGSRAEGADQRGPRLSAKAVSATIQAFDAIGADELILIPVFEALDGISCLAEVCQRPY